MIDVNIVFFIGTHIFHYRKNFKFDHVNDSHDHFSAYIKLSLFSINLQLTFKL